MTPAPGAAGSPRRPESTSSGDAATPRRPRSRQGGAVTFLAFAAAIVMLYAGREIIIPLALAIFFAFLLSGVSRRIERRWINRVSAVAITLAVAAIAVLGVGAVVFYQAAIIIQELPDYRDNIRTRLTDLQTAVSTRFGAAADAVEEIQSGLEDAAPNDPTVPGPVSPEEAEPLRVEVVEGGGAVYSNIRAALQAVAHPLLTVGVASVFTFFFMVYREDLRDRLLKLLGQARLTVSTNALMDAGSRVSRYIRALTIANGVAGTAVAVGLYFIGVPNWFLWGALTALLRYIPFLGPFIAALLPATMSFAVSESWAQPLMTIAWFIFVDVASANLVEPWLYGTRTGASPTAIVFAFIFWTWLWGPFGLFLAAPLTVCLVALGRYIPDLEFFYVLLGDQPVFRPEARLYQRLLAHDAVEARRVIDEAGREFDPLTVFDRIIAPAFARVCADWNSGILEDHRREQVRKAALAALEPPDDATEPEETDAPGVPERTLLVCPSDHPLDEALARAARQAIAAIGLHTVPCAGPATEGRETASSREGAVLAMLVVSSCTEGGARHGIGRWRERDAARHSPALVLNVRPSDEAATRAWAGRPSPHAARHCRSLGDALACLRALAGDRLPPAADSCDAPSALEPA